jgi:type I restriction enzyme, S subunit
MMKRNENRPGYKSTKIGWIPEEWECERLDSLSEIQTGAAKSSKKLLKNPILLPYLRVANVQDGYLDLSEMKQLSIERTKIKRYLLKLGDVLFTEGGDFDKLGRGTIWMGQIPNCIHQNHIFVVRVHCDLLLPIYLASIAASKIGRKYFLLCSKQSTNLASINSTQLKAFPIPLPPLPEQKRIAEILSAWDRAIEITGKLIDAKQLQKKGISQQLLTGRRRFPKFQPQSIQKQSDQFPEGWRMLRLGKMLTESRIKGSTGESARKLTVKLYGKGIVPKNEKRPGSIQTQYYLRKAGQFIYSKLDFLNGAFAIIPNEFDGFESTLDLPAFDMSMDISQHWFLEYISRKSFYLKYVGLANGGRKARRVNPKELLKIQIKLPSFPEQRSIADFLLSCDYEIELLSQNLSKLQEQKKGLMQKLLTGEIRV